MTKCSTCREKEVELLTWWERTKNWLFNHLFPQDIIDLSQDKYTQGFSDGYVKGMNKGRITKSVEELEDELIGKMAVIDQSSIQTIIGNEEL